MITNYKQFKNRFLIIVFTLMFLSCGEDLEFAYNDSVLKEQQVETNTMSVAVVPPAMPDMTAFRTLVNTSLNRRFANTDTYLVKFNYMLTQ